MAISDLSRRDQAILTRLVTDLDVLSAMRSVAAISQRDDSTNLPLIGMQGKLLAAVKAEALRIATAAAQELVRVNNGLTNARPLAELRGPASADVVQLAAALRAWRQNASKTVVAGGGVGMRFAAGLRGMGEVLGDPAEAATSGSAGVLHRAADRLEARRPGAAESLHAARRAAAVIERVEQALTSLSDGLSAGNAGFDAEPDQYRDALAVLREAGAALQVIDPHAGGSHDRLQVGALDELLHQYGEEREAHLRVLMSVARRAVELGADDPRRVLGEVDMVMTLIAAGGGLDQFEEFVVDQDFKALTDGLDPRAANERVDVTSAVPDVCDLPGELVDPLAAEGLDDVALERLSEALPTPAEPDLLTPGNAAEGLEGSDGITTDPVDLREGLDDGPDLGGGPGALGGDGPGGLR